MVERAALEMRYTRKRIEGSNPPLSAKKEIKLSVQVYLSKQFYFFCKDAFGRLRDYVEIIVRSKAEIRNPPTFRMPSTDLMDYAVIIVRGKAEIRNPAPYSIALQKCHPNKRSQSFVQYA